VEKSKYLTQKGIDLFKTEIEVKENYKKMDEAKKLFKAALRFDQLNLTAARYLIIIDDYKTVKIKERLGAIDKLTGKKNRSSRDNYYICYNIQKAFELDPSNNEVITVRNETKSTRDTLVKKYIGESDKIEDRLKMEDPDNKKTITYLQSLDWIGWALSIDPENSIVKNKHKSVLKELAVIFQRETALFNEKKENGDYPGAESVLKNLMNINKRLLEKFASEEKKMGYSLNYNWAKEFLAKNQLYLADQKINIALKYNRSKEAINLKKKITSKIKEGKAQKLSDQINKQDIVDAGKAQELYNQGIVEIDSYLSKGDIIAAYDKIQWFLIQTTNKAEMDQLMQREKKVKLELPGLYSRAIEAYNAEKFDYAIELLQIIVKIDSDFEQASSYLDNARSKQNLLKNF
jgi:hypothetical protein